MCSGEEVLGLGLNISESNSEFWDRILYGAVSQASAGFSVTWRYWATCQKPCNTEHSHIKYVGGDWTVELDKVHVPEGVLVLNCLCPPLIVLFSLPNSNCAMFPPPNSICVMPPPPHNTNCYVTLLKVIMFLSPSLIVIFMFPLPLTLLIVIVLWSPHLIVIPN